MTKPIFEHADFNKIIDAYADAAGWKDHGFSAPEVKWRRLGEKIADLRSDAAAARDEVARLNRALDLLLPMAREYAEAGGRHGPERRTYAEARDLAGRGE